MPTDSRLIERDQSAVCMHTRMAPRGELHATLENYLTTIHMPFDCAHKHCKTKLEYVQSEGKLNVAAHLKRTGLAVPLSAMGGAVLLGAEPYGLTSLMFSAAFVLLTIQYGQKITTSRALLAAFSFAAQEEQSVSTTHYLCPDGPEDVGRKHTVIKEHPILESTLTWYRGPVCYNVTHPVVETQSQPGASQCRDDRHARR